MTEPRPAERPDTPTASAEPEPASAEPASAEPEPEPAPTEPTPEEPKPGHPDAGAQEAAVSAVSAAAADLRARGFDAQAEGTDLVLRAGRTTCRVENTFQPRTGARREAEDLFIALVVRHLVDNGPEPPESQPPESQPPEDPSPPS